MTALVNVLQFEITGAESYGFRVASGNESSLYAGDASDGDAGAVLSVEPFGLNHDLGSGWASGRGSHSDRKEKKLAVGENTVNVEKEEFDFLGAVLGGRFLGHRGDFSILAHKATDELVCNGLKNQAVLITIDAEAPAFVDPKFLAQMMGISTAPVALTKAVPDCSLPIAAKAL